MQEPDIRDMLDDLEVLVDANELTDEDTDFVERILDMVSADYDSTSSLTDEQVSTVAQVWRKYFR